LQTFCQSEGLRVPDAAEILERSEPIERPERSEHAERSMDVPQEIEILAEQYLAQVMARQSDYFEAFLRDELSHLVNRVVEHGVDQVVERLAERSPPAIPALTKPEKAEVLLRIRELQAAGLSLQKIADHFNNKGVPTLSGKGTWKEGTVSNLLKEEG
jgi:hypothetical protein